MNRREAAIDPLLASWDEKLRRADENLLALEAEPTYQMLAGAHGTRAPLDGMTRARVEPALDALAQLFEQRAALGDVVARAKAIRAEFSAIWKNDEKVAQIERLLFGPSIKLAPQSKPLAQRRLLDAPVIEVAVVPEDLLRAMGKTFETARDAVLAVSSAWARLAPAIEQAEREVVMLRRKADSLGDAMQADEELLGVERELAVLRARVARDPLGVASMVDGPFAEGVANARARVEAMAAARVEAAQKLGQAAQLRRAIEDARARGDAAKARIESAFARADLGPHVDASLLEGLDVWLAKIEGTARAGRWSSAVVGLARWISTAESYLASERAILDAAEALTAKHAELAGRLDARRAQLAAFRSRRANATTDVTADAELDELARRAAEAEAALRERPVALEEATAHVEAFEGRLAKILHERK